MNEEIFEEVVTDTIDTPTDNIDMDNSIQEAEEDNSISQDELIHALLQLLNEQNVEEEDTELLQNELDQEENLLPVLVQSVDSLDYSLQLQEISNRLESLESTIVDINQPATLDTSLKDYDLNSILLVCVLVVLFMTLGYQFIKDNLLHL